MKGYRHSEFTKLRMRFAKQTGIPTTKEGIINKMERILINEIIDFLK